MTSEQILALAPDASSASAGKGLANARKWSNLGVTESAIWGECQGSGSKPYQTQIDPSEPAFKCSCPSRKFPCKHGLGLYLLFSGQKDLFTQTTEPDWVSKWLESRQERAEKSVQKAEEKAAKETDPATIARRSASRETKVAAGLKELELWLSDLVRGGLATAPNQPYTFWDTMGARLVDAQCSTLARRVRNLAGVATTGRGWQSELLWRLSQIHLIVEGWKRHENLDAPLVDELRTQIGWTFKEDELNDSDAVEDEWCVLGQRSEEEDQIRLIKTWLWGARSGRPAVYLQFGHASQALAPQFVPRTKLRAKAIFYPGVAPLRATFRDKGIVESLEESEFAFASTIATATETYSKTLAKNPWLEALPVALKNSLLLFNDSNWSVRDEAGDEWPISPLFDRQWELLAASGGKNVVLFGEWNGQSLLPFHWEVTA